MSEQPQERITPPPALGPPIIGPDTAGSAPGIAQPQDTGQNPLPPSLPAGTKWTSPGWGWLPPPQVGMGANAPFPSTPVNYPGVMSPWPVTQPALPVQPQFATGSGTSPTAASLFPSFTAAGPNPPIVVNATQAAGTGTQFPADWIKPPFPIPTTAGILAVVLDDWGLGAGPGGLGNEAIFPPPVPASPPDSPPDDGENGEEPEPETLGERLHLPNAANAKARSKPKGRRR